MTNPITMATGLVAGLGVALNKAKNEAALFNSEFRELINLNLDKTPFQKALLKSDVLRMAKDKGFDPLKTSTAFYDVQSITGKYGYDVGKITEMGGNFAQVLRSDFNKTIAGSAQAMEIYGFDVNRLDNYLASLYKTVMAGKTSFDEVTTVQVEYANAAASVGQTFDQANKVYAAFSKATKSVNIAATMTKTAFEDLTKKSTLEGLNKIGVSVFDAKGQMKGVDTILQNLIPKLKTMTDLEYARLKEEIGGSEGLRGLFDQARNSADKMLASFDLFDRTEFKMSEALKEASKDINHINDQINNKLKVSWINLGQTVLPVWVSLKTEILSIIDDINNSMYDKVRSYYRIFDQGKYRQMGSIRSQQYQNEGYGNARDKYVEMFRGNLSELTESELKAKMDALQEERKKINTPPKYKPLGWTDQDEADASNKLQGFNRFFNEVSLALKNKNFDAISELYGSGTGSSSGGEGSGGGTGGTDVSKGLQDIAGGGTQLKNVTVNIEKLNESININTTNFSDSASDIEKKLTELLVRSVSGAEQVL
jgi:TP901 family phage tail tape measure protein